MTDNARLAVVTKNRTNPAYGGALVGATRIADRHGATIDYFAPETPDSIPEQIALLEEAAAGNYDAMLVMPAHESELDETLERIIRAGTPIVFVVTRPKRIRGITFVSSDDKALAAATAAHLFDHLGGSGKVVIVDGHPNSTTTPDRHAGFLQAAADYPGIEILDMQSGGYQRAPAHDLMRTLLARHPVIDGIVSANDLMSLGIIDALHETGRTIPLVSINGTPDAIAAIKAGDMLSTTEFSTLSFGAVAAEAALRHIAGKPVPHEIMLPTRIITAHNIAAWDKPYEERECLTWDDAVTP
jgi:ABC-type sugar transport system substrate-binding protein